LGDRAVRVHPWPRCRCRDRRYCAAHRPGARSGEGSAHGSRQGRRPARATGHDHRRGAPGLARCRLDRRRLDLGMGPLLLVIRRPGRQPFRGVLVARRHGRRHQPGALRRARDLLRVPQPQPPGRPGAHTASPQWRTLRPRNRLGLVRARLPRVRLRVRDRGWPPAPPRPPPPGAPRAPGHGLPVIKARLAALRPPAAALPILVAGAGELVTLRRAAEHADAWNTFGPPAIFRRKNQVLDEWCADVGRDPAAIERTVAIRPDEVGALDTYVDAGADHVIVMTAAPYDLEPVRRALT